MTERFLADLTAHVSSGFAALRDDEAARAMAAYMKTDMPFYGVPKPARAPTMRALFQRFSPPDEDTYRAAVLALWALPHREEKYAALAYADRFKRFQAPSCLPLFERLIREGQWWDLVDIVATNLVGTAFKRDRKTVTPLMEAWNVDDDLWIRRASILSQNRHRAETDEALLFRLCLARADEKDFFIRKAIGWALRDYSRVAPQAVQRFLLRHQDALSGLSVREGAKRLAREGQWPVPSS